MLCYELVFKLALFGDDSTDADEKEKIDYIQKDQ